MINKGDKVIIVGCAEGEKYKGCIFEVLSQPYVVCSSIVVKMKCNETGKYFGGGYDVAFLKKMSEKERLSELLSKALEKQTPKKVILGRDEQDYVRCPQCKSEIAAMDDDCLLYHCPSCGEKDAILQGDNYCFNCGQALDWSGEK